MWIDDIKDALPDYAKDIRLNLENVMLRSSLEPGEAEGCALAAAIATGNQAFSGYLSNQFTGDQITERDAAWAAAAIMAQNNVYYPYLEMTDEADGMNKMPAGLRMNVIASHGGTTKERFESYSLAASIVGKCKFCVNAHYKTLKEAGYSVKQLQDIGRIAAVITAVGKLLVINTPSAE